MSVPASNPFATRFTRPGRIVPLDDSGKPLDIHALLERLRAAGGTAAIVGPHGSGKTTLLVHIADALEHRGVRVERLRLRSCLGAAAAMAAIRRAGPGATVCIDSWECLGPMSRMALRMAARAYRCGILVTMHRSGGMPVLMRCCTSPALLGSICGNLPDHDGWYGTLVDFGDVQAAFVRQRGNIREAMYDLYDAFERRSRQVTPQRS